MTNAQQTAWTYPGSRWWKFDFHTHTPASLDTSAWQRAKNTPNEVTPEKWLLKYMEAGIDCVAVTDHNSGAWVDKLKSAYDNMHQQASEGTAPDGFRELTLFPGVEISVNGGFHLLAILGPNASTSDIDSLLGAVDYKGTKGDSDNVTGASATQVMRSVLHAGGIPIPAHSDQDKGLLRVNPGTRESAIDANTVRQVVDTEELLAVEWVDMTLPMPGCVGKDAAHFARVLGSDCHSFQGNGVPGSRFTWIKMANPSLEGLRLALLDGNGISVRRSDEGDFEPFKTPAHFITNVEIESASFMGRRSPECLNFTPFCNALVGGRGTGKSTIIHALRLAYRRVGELRRLGDANELHQKFISFARPMKDRHRGGGALREETEIRVHLSREGVMHRLRWRQDGKGVVVEEQNTEGEWGESKSAVVTKERFPIHLFSQGQIAAMAGESRQALLDVIDEGAGISDLHRAFEEAKAAYFSQRAQMRELDGRLAGRPELERKLAESKRKLDALAQSHHSEVLRAHQRARRQHREVETTFDQLKAMPKRIDSLTREIQIDDWPEGAFGVTQDQDILAWRDEVERVLSESRDELSKVARAFEQQLKLFANDSKLSEWHKRTVQAKTDYETLQAALAEQGVTDPQAFGRLVQERQQFDDQLKQLRELRKKRRKTSRSSLESWKRVVDARKAITEARREFVRKTLANNSFVRMEVVGFGFEAKNIERDLRSLLDCEDDRFEGDIHWESDGEESGGMAFDIAQAGDRDREEVLENAKKRLIEPDNEFGGHFRNYLRKKLEKPELADHICCWFPSDDLRIEYSRGGDGSDWSTITQGSQGQRSAALLAFLLAFGSEPLVLDQPEDDLDNHLIYDLIVSQIRQNKLRRQLIIVTHNPNVVINGDAEMVHALDFRGGQCRVMEHGALQEVSVRDEVCRVMEGGREAFTRRWNRLGRGG